MTRRTVFDITKIWYLCAVWIEKDRWMLLILERVAGNTDPSVRWGTYTDNRLSSSYKWCRQCDNQLISTTLLRKKYARNETKKLLRRKRNKKLWNSLIIYRIVPIFGFQIFIFTCKKNSILSSAWSSNDRYWGGVLGWIGFDRMRNKHTAIIVKLDVQYSFCTFEEIN